MITMKDVIKEGHPTLRSVAKEVEIPASKEDKETLRKMMEFLHNSQNPETAEKYGLRPGIGLAAPQINVNKRMIAVLVNDENGNLHEYALYNPKIVSHSVEMTQLENGEGCLSVDRDVPGLVPRYARITVQATSIDEEEISIRLKGLTAIVFQHEIDHLNGIMFYDRIVENNDPFKKSIPSSFK
ncbi:peptide deformylase [Anaerobacillus alkalidiazotrophicus]|uniref:Peptide deformylase n=1 Tax=Anaerobacillus alkalidiazotrophicus TaxID=472963 RepID=A0A1S2M2G6_9BACI|nr:peptide deformylase [Anaerobacillus alkalidiazotrophicus]OIJ18710.1 peptide deformylase [Anaerobacillus alkalidiazotrophicus]